VTTGFDSPTSMSTLREVRFTPSAGDILQPDPSAASSVPVADVLAIVSDETHSFVHVQVSIDSFIHLGYWRVA